MWGLAAVLLLTPPAMAIAVLGICTAASQLPKSIPWQAVFVVPFAVLLVLMVAATLLDYLARGAAKWNFGRAILFLATPFAVALATGLGGAIADNTYPNGPWLVVFYASPTIALIFMLSLAWYMHISK